MTADRSIAKAAHLLAASVLQCHGQRTLATLRASCEPLRPDHQRVVLTSISSGKGEINVPQSADITPSEICHYRDISSG
ncbi:hypothetical protein PY730_27830 (plasmid) [Klebsiella pneumoniae]|nr:hypothetical protein PY730_27830 [Klebsiella pneumoniae]